MKTNVVNSVVNSDNLCPKCKGKIGHSTIKISEKLVTVVFCTQCYDTIDVIA